MDRIQTADVLAKVREALARYAPKPPWRRYRSA
jgi:hypothetical protein